MQTFLPYPSFEESARVLDMRRLGKQRVEVKQLLLALGVPVGGHKPNDHWASHPAAKMWKGHERFLCAYGVAICDEWLNRGYNDTLYGQFVDAAVGKKWSKPLWLGNEDFHLAHKSNLIRKDPEHYRKFWPDVPDDLPYIWPTGA